LPIAFSFHHQGSNRLSIHQRPYGFREDVLTRTYEPMIRKAESTGVRDQLGVEYLALNRCYEAYVQSGMVGISSADPSRLQAASPFESDRISRQPNVRPVRGRLAPRLIVAHRRRRGI
jgi:hypothetical protein